MNKIAAQFYKIVNLIELKKLKHTAQLKNKLQLVDQMLGYHLLKESWLIITIAGPTVANKKDQNSRELDIILGNRSKGSNIPTKILFEKSGFGKNKNPKNKPNIINIIKIFSFKFFL